MDELIDSYPRMATDTQQNTHTRLSAHCLYNGRNMTLSFMHRVHTAGCTTMDTKDHGVPAGIRAERRMLFISDFGIRRL